MECFRSATQRENAFSGDDLAFLTQVARQVALAIENALAYGEVSEQKQKLTLEKLYLEDELRSEGQFEEIIGRSESLGRVLDQIATVAPTDSTVLIYGETGSGKELIARAVHNLSARKSGAFVKLNCAAIPTGLLESEMFGHERGAFTGAISQRIGRFELANRGTIFLDEIGDIPLELQPKLLRVLQEREFERLGSTRTMRSDARLIAATNRDLDQFVAEGKFRSDLYYRLNVFPVRVPALRERPEDIPLLVRHFVQQFSRRLGKTIDAIPAETMTALTRYPWPGNIRELQNVIERAVILTNGPVLSVHIDDLRAPSPPAPIEHIPTATSPLPSHLARDLRSALEESERQQIMAALEKSNWVVAGPEGAAARLGLKRSTLQSRMQKLGIRISRTGALTLMADGRGSQPGTELLRRLLDRFVRRDWSRASSVGEVGSQFAQPDRLRLSISAGSASSRMAASAIRMPSKTSNSNAARGNRSIASRACSRSAFVVSGLSDQLRGGASEPWQRQCARELSPARRIGKLIVDCGQSSSDNEPSLPAPHPIREERIRIVARIRQYRRQFDTEILASRQKESQPVEIGSVLSDVLCIFRGRHLSLL